VGEQPRSTRTDIDGPPPVALGSDRRATNRAAHSV
jgi:hypothetical protein